MSPKRRQSQLPSQPEFNKTVLDCGVSVVSEGHDQSRAVSLGAWIPNGTRDEPNGLHGVSHFVEHLVFKGTKTRSAFEIVRALESVGGDLNAFTTREYTCFHAICLSEHLGLALDVICELVSQARFSKNDFDKEKQVVLQEILMAADNFEEYVFDLFFEKAYGRHPLGRPILGTPDTLAGMSRQEVLDFYRRRYATGELIVSGAGFLKHEEFALKVEKALGKVPRHSLSLKRRAPKFHAFRHCIEKPSEQVHILMGWPAARFSGPDRFEAFIVNAWLGGGMTSHLYQIIREKLGLVYSIYSQLQTFTDCGLCLVYAGVQPKQAKLVTERINREVEKLVRRGINQRELHLFKTQVRGSILLGADDVENRMNSLGVNEMVFGRYRSVESVINEIDKISVESVNQYIKRYMDGQSPAILLLGRLEDEKTQQWLEAT